MRFIFDNSKDKDEQEEKRAESKPLSRKIKVSVSLGTSGTRSAEVEVPASGRPTQDQLMTGFLRGMGSSPDIEDRMFAEQVQRRYGEPANTVERRMGEEFYPLRRDEEIIVGEDEEVMFSIAVDHVGGVAILTS